MVENYIKFKLFEFFVCFELQDANQLEKIDEKKSRTKIIGRSPSLCQKNQIGHSKKAAKTVILVVGSFLLLCFPYYIFRTAVALTYFSDKTSW